MTLSDSHRRTLEVGSAISPEVTDARGVRTISRPGELPECFNDRQRRRAPGWLANLYRPNGKRSQVFRPDRTPPEKPGWKYEQIPKAHGGGNVLDIHPFCRQWIHDRSVPVLFAEGTKKGDSLISALRESGVKAVVVSIIGCWNWVHNGGQPIPDLADIPLEGRRVVVVPDSDVLTKWQVQLAFQRLAEYLRDERAAEVSMTFLNDLADGSKCGADDFFATGGTLAELRILTRRYDPDDFVRVRLSRSERLRAMLEDLYRQYAAMPAAKVGECSDRATMREALRRARQHGTPEARGIMVRLSVRSLAIKTRLGRQGQANSLKRLQANGYIERIEEAAHKVEKHGAAYLLKASTGGSGRAESGHYRRGSPQQNVSQEQGEGEKPLSYADSYTGVHSARAPSAAVPELRHSKVIHTWAYRRGRRVVVDSEYVYRLAKPRQEVLMYLLDCEGGEATEAELLEGFGSKSTRPRDFHRRKIEPLMGWRYSRDKRTGQERRMETGPQIVACEDGVVRILPEWREALEKHRKQTGELEDNARQEQRLRDQSKAYRGRDRTPADEQPNPLLGKERNKRNVAARAREDRQRWVEEQRQKVGITAMTFLADEIDGEYGVRFGDAAERWRSLHGGAVSELWRAARYGPFVFRRVEGNLFIDPEPLQGEETTPAPAPRKMPPKNGEGVYVHGPECDCWWCDEGEGGTAPSKTYATTRRGAA
jgi:hypothetical protein